MDGQQFFGVFKGKTLGKFPEKNGRATKKVVVDGRDSNIARPFIRGGCILKNRKINVNE